MPRSIPTLPADATGYAIAQEPPPCGGGRCPCGRPLGAVFTVSPTITGENERGFCSLECAIRAIVRVEWLRRVKAPTC